MPTCVFWRAGVCASCCICMLLLCTVKRTRLGALCDNTSARGAAKHIWHIIAIYADILRMRASQLPN